MSKDRVEDRGEFREGRGGNVSTVPAEMETMATLRSEDLGEDENLLPGIHNDIALQMIAPTLSWTDLNILSSVSPRWQQEIQGRQVYDARVRSQLTEPLAFVAYIIHRSGGPIHALGVYCMRDKSWCALPPIPFPGGNRAGSTFIPLDGKIYMLGGAIPNSVRDVTGSREVYVLDVAGQRQWKQCASMHQGRLRHAAGVVHGKIYVFGGCSDWKYVRECEMYDPKADAWFPIKDINPCRVNHQVATVGTELFVYGGYVHHGLRIHPRNLIAYHPVQDEWRHIEDSDVQVPHWEYVFMAQGKVHKMTQRHIHVYDIDKNLWSVMHSFSALPGQVLDFVNFFLLQRRIAAVGDELLIVHHFTDEAGKTRPCLLQSRGFGSRKEEIVWEMAKSPVDISQGGQLTHISYICPIQL